MILPLDNIDIKFNQQSIAVRRQMLIRNQNYTRAFPHDKK